MSDNNDYLNNNPDNGQRMFNPETGEPMNANNQAFSNNYNVNQNNNYENMNQNNGYYSANSDMNQNAGYYNNANAGLNQNNGYYSANSNINQNAGYYNNASAGMNPNNGSYSTNSDMNQNSGFYYNQNMGNDLNQQPQTTFYTNNSNSEDMRFYEKPKKSKKKKIGIFALAGVLVAAITVGIVFFLKGRSSAASGNAKEEIQTAIENTLKSGKFFNNLSKIGNYGKNGKVTVEFAVNSEDGNIKGSAAVDKDAKKIYANLDFYDSNNSFNGEFLIDDKFLSAKVPMLTDKVIQYNYKDDKSGAIKDLFKESGYDLSQFDEVLASIFAPMKEMKEIENTELYKDVSDSVSYEEIKSKKFTVDGKEVSCTGYQMTIKPSDIKKVVNNYLSLTKKYMSQYGDTVNESELQEGMNEINKGLDLMGDIKINYYIKNKRLAAIEVCNSDASDVYVTVEFLGGNTGLENYKITVSEKLTGLPIVLAKKGTTSGNSESASYSVNGQEIFKSQYDATTGEYKFGNQDYGIYIAGQLKVNDNEYKFTIDQIASPSLYDSSPSISFGIKNSASISELTGEKADISEMTEQELQDFVTDIYSNMYEY